MKIFYIGLNTFREAVRDKVLYSLVFFAMIMIGLGTVIDRITIGQTDKIIKDFGLACISIFGVLIAIFMGINLVFKELEKKTIYTILSKPIYRFEFLFGKFLGLLLTLLIETSVMTAGLFLSLVLFSAEGWDALLLKAIVLIYVQLSIVTAVALFFSSFSTPFLSGMFSLSIYIIGNLTEDLLVFSKRFDVVGQKLTQAIYYIMPNLSILNIKGKVIYHQVISWSDYFGALAYGILYTAFLLLLSALVFERREFK